MNEQTRYRVTGSLFLLAVAIVCLPMLFDGDGLPSVSLEPLSSSLSLPEVQPFSEVTPQSDFVARVDALRRTVDEEGFHRETHTLFGEPVLGGTVSATDVWAVQVASFAEHDNALSFRSQLRDDGYEAFLSTIKNGNAIRYRVAVGPLLDLTEAEILQQQLSGQYEVEARLMAFAN